MKYRTCAMEYVQQDSWVINQGFGQLSKRLQETGFVRMRCKDRHELLEIGKSLGVVHFHTDSEETGLTHVAHASDFLDADTMATNKLGFTQAELIPHTDRSGTKTPPKYVVFWIERPAEIGGRNLLVDGHALFEDLSANGDPTVVQALMRPNSVIFRGSQSYLESSFFEIHNGSLRIRFRNDGLVYTAPDISKVLDCLMEGIKRNVDSFYLEAGEGYIIDNHRWLHGRTQFVGSRSAYRLLVDEG